MTIYYPFSGSIEKVHDDAWKIELYGSEESIQVYAQHDGLYNL